MRWWILILIGIMMIGITAFLVYQLIKFIDKIKLKRLRRKYEPETDISRKENRNVKTGLNTIRTKSPGTKQATDGGKQQPESSDESGSDKILQDVVDSIIEGDDTGNKGIKRDSKPKKCKKE